MDVPHHGGALVLLATLRLRVGEVQDHANHTQEEAHDQTREGTLQAGAGRQGAAGAWGGRPRPPGPQRDLSKPSRRARLPRDGPRRGQRVQQGWNHLSVSHIQFVNDL